MIKLSRASQVQQAGRMLCVTVLALASFTTTARSQTSNSVMITQIDTGCSAIQDAVMALRPIHIAYKSGRWVVLSDADFTVAAETKVAIVAADVYKQGSKYAWVSGA